MSAEKSSEESTSYLGVYFYALVLALLGALLGFAFMASFPPQSFGSLAEYEASIAEPETDEEQGPTYLKPGDAYYIEGSIMPGRAWEAKRQQLMASGPQTIRMTAGEFNGWMSAKFRAAQAPTGDDAPSVLIVPGVPNVAFVGEDSLYLNVPVTLTAYGATGEFMASVYGGVNASGLQIKSFRVSSAKIPLPQIIGRQILNTIGQGYQETEEYTIISEALERAESLSIVDGELVVQLR